MKLTRVDLSLAVWLWAAMSYATEASPAKFALVIGNAAYPGKAQLANTLSDAQLMADTFRKLGYQTTLLKDANRAAMIGAVAQLAGKTNSGGIAALYFAGHGLQLAGENYLLPIGLPPLTQKLVKDDTYPLQLAIDRLRNSGAQISLIFIDACRNDPYGMAYRSLPAEGLAEPKPAKGMLIAYSTAPGQLALDGKSGDHSPFAKALAESMLQPGIDIDVVFAQVRSSVRAQTKDEQQPWVSSSLVGDFYFRPPLNLPIKKVAITQPAKISAGRRTSQLTDLETKSNQSAPVTPPRSEWFQHLGPDALTLEYNELASTAHHLTKDDFPRLIRKAKSGNVIAQTTLGIAYREGSAHRWGSNPKAVKWFRIASAQGFAIAQNELAEMYFLGRGVDKNVPQSIRLFQAAANAGYMSAKLNLIQAQAGNDPKQLAEQLTSLLGVH